MAVCAIDFKHSFCLRNMRKTHHLDILPDNAPGSVKIRPTTVWRSRDGITGWTPNCKETFASAGVPFCWNQRFDFLEDGIPNCVRTGNDPWVSKQFLEPGATSKIHTLTCITPSPSVTFWDTSMTQTLNNQSQLCQLTHVSRPVSRWIRLFEKAGYKLTKCNRMEPDAGGFPRVISWTAQRILESLRLFQV